MAVTIAVESELIVPAVPLNVAVVDAAATVTEAGTVNATLLLERETGKPPAGAGLDNVIVQVLAAAVPRVVGAHARDVTRVGADSERVAFWELLLKVAVTTAVWSAGMVPAVALNVAVIEPAATVTDPATVNRTLLLESETTAPPLGAAFDSVTVQVLRAAVLRVVGAHAKEVTRVGADRERVVFCEVPLYVAVTTAVWSEPMVPAVALNVAVVEPAATVTDPATVSRILLLESETTVPPLGAVFVSVTVHELVAPVLSVVGTQARELRLIGADKVNDAVFETPA